jgi:DNA-binding transcriptional LysR family regulator
LVTLRALLRTSSVTRAAEALGQTQPTVSRALGTLRATFDDPLLVRAGRGMVLTPKAEALSEPLGRMLAGIGRLSRLDDFTPATSRRRFRVLVPELLAPVVVPPVTVRTRAEAPGVALQFLAGERELLSALLEGEVDLAVVAPALDHPELQTRRVSTRLSWSVVYGPSHPCWDGVLDEAAWLASGHVQVTPHGRPDVPGQVDELLAARGQARHKAVQLSSVGAAGELLSQLPLVCSLPRPIARWMAALHGLRCTLHPMDEAMPRLGLRLYWHVSAQHDPAHRWLREIVVATVRDLGDDGGAREL